MDIYHAWCDLKPGVSDITFSEQVAAYTGHLKVAGRRASTEGFHFGVNALVQNVAFGGYRDSPDAFRHRGDERF